ncbi:hypothetical protein WN51_05126 [Melipona quadrifasciata]|uniref:Uncharacterized protein n=1 Tax=Melipona quadrifasciata TaxID=166423 RepID=A0A0N0BD33_9HYME|nr:hypothetical protein WN51_05126 [Melipona quadrifasciata]
MVLTRSHQHLPESKKKLYEETNPVQRCDNEIRKLFLVNGKIDGKTSPSSSKGILSERREEEVAQQSEEETVTRCTRGKGGGMSVGRKYGAEGWGGRLGGSMSENKSKNKRSSVTVFVLGVDRFFEVIFDSFFTFLNDFLADEVVGMFGKTPMLKRWSKAKRKCSLIEKSQPKIRNVCMLQILECCYKDRNSGVVSLSVVSHVKQCIFRDSNVSKSVKLQILVILTILIVLLLGNYFATLTLSGPAGHALSQMEKKGKEMTVMTFWGTKDEDFFYRVRISVGLLRVYGFLIELFVGSDGSRVTSQRGNMSAVVRYSYECGEIKEIDTWLYVGVRVAIEFNRPGFGHQDKSSVISKASQQSKGKDLASNPRKQPSLKEHANLTELVTSEPRFLYLPQDSKSKDSKSNLRHITLTTLKKKRRRKKHYDINCPSGFLQFHTSAKTNIAYSLCRKKEKKKTRLEQLPKKIRSRKFEDQPPEELELRTACLRDVAVPYGDSREQMVQDFCRMQYVRDTETYVSDGWSFRDMRQRLNLKEPMNLQKNSSILLPFRSFVGNLEEIRKNQLKNHPSYSFEKNLETNFLNEFEEISQRLMLQPPKVPVFRYTTTDGRVDISALFGSSGVSGVQLRVCKRRAALFVPRHQLIVSLHLVCKESLLEVNDKRETTLRDLINNAVQLNTVQRRFLPVTEGILKLSESVEFLGSLIGSVIRSWPLVPPLFRLLLPPFLNTPRVILTNANCSQRSSQSNIMSYPITSILSIENQAAASYFSAAALAAAGFYNPAAHLPATSSPGPTAHHLQGKGILTSPHHHPHLNPHGITPPGCFDATAKNFELTKEVRTCSKEIVCQRCRTCSRRVKKIGAKRIFRTWSRLGGRVKEIGVGRILSARRRKIGAIKLPKASFKYSPLDDETLQLREHFTTQFPIYLKITQYLNFALCNNS